MSQQFTYTFIADGFTNTLIVTADVTATNDGNGTGYNVTAISGSFDGQTITGMYGSAGSPQLDANGNPYDNVIFTADDQGVNGFSSNGIDGVGLDFTTTNGNDYNIASYGADLFSYVTDDNAAGPVTLVATDAPCYCAGSLILTDRGEIAVEKLAVGDRIVTASGALRPIRWIGHRTVDCARHPDPERVWPVRISANAFGEGLPRRDLWLSPGHNVASERALMPICALANGQSVAQIQQDKVEYWHVELDAHDILFAEGLPVESYLDCGNRNAFSNGGDFTEAHPDFRPKHWADTCLPLMKEGPPVVLTKARLIARLAEHGLRVNQEADAHIVVDGLRVEPICLSETRLAFALPAGGREIALRSKTFVPAHTVAESADPRELGLCVMRLQIDGEAIAIDKDDACVSGWHEAEFVEGSFARRWTRGAVSLPAGARIAIVDLAGVGYYWRMPENNVVAMFARNASGAQSAIRPTVSRVREFAGSCLRG